MFKFKKRYCELNASLIHILRMCRFSGHFPVENLRDVTLMRFNVKSFYMVYYILTWLSLSHTIVGYIRKYISKVYKKGDVVSGMVIVSVIVVTAILLKFGKHWPALVKDATNIEQSIAEVVRVSKWTHVKCAVISYAIVALAVVEHLLYTYFRLQFEIFCSNNQQLTVEVLDKFLKHHYDVIFNYLPFYRWIGIFGEFLRLQNCVIWNVTDILGMCFSVYLTSYFRELGKIIHLDQIKDWGKIRACYCQLVILMNLINRQLAPFVLLTSLSNLFFICVQLYRSLHFIFSEDDVEKKLPECGEKKDSPSFATSYILYSVFSSTFLILRSMGFVYLATNVHTSAYKALLPIYEVPSEDYNEDVIATIVTYELVLLQFSLPRRQPVIFYYPFYNFTRKYQPPYRR